MWTWILALIGVALGLVNAITIMTANPSLWMALLAILAGVCFGFTFTMVGIALDGDLFGAWWRYTQQLKRQQNGPEV